MIDRDIKRCLGQMIKGVQVIAATHEGETRGYCSHWFSQVSFEEPIVLASASPKHDTYPLIEAAGAFTASILAADQIDVGQYFSYPGRKFGRIATEWLAEAAPGVWAVPDAIAWLHCEVFDRIQLVDHTLFLARVTQVGPGRLREPPLLYSSRLGWRVTGGRAREPGTSVRDRLLDRLEAAGLDVGDDGGDDD